MAVTEGDDGVTWLRLWGVIRSSAKSSVGAVTCHTDGVRRLMVPVAVFSMLFTACASGDQPEEAPQEDAPAAAQVPDSLTESTFAPEPPTESTSSDPEEVVESDGSAATESTESEPDDPSPLVVSHPIADLGAMWASQPYATQENEIGIQFHNGVDYFVNEREVTVLSAVSGTFKEARVVERQPDGAFQVNLMIVTDGGQVVTYSLEPSAGPADSAKIAEQAILSQQMLDAISVQRNSRVEIGQPIGVLLGQDEWAHVHMTIKQSNGQPEIWLCPMIFMAIGERDELLEPTQVWADRLYKGSKSPALCNE